jgi:hypothetical protein
MRPASMSLQVGLPHLLVWIGIVALLVTGYFVYQSWRRRHPKRAARQASYSERLGLRLAEGRKGRKAPSSRMQVKPGVESFREDS